MNKQLIHDEMWDELTDRFPNFADATVEVWHEYVISSHILLDISSVIHAGSNQCW